MSIEFEDQEAAGDSLIKWPFYASALFIFLITGVFAYLHFQQEGILGTWQLISCIFASAVASILLFFPFFVEKTLLLFSEGNKPKEEEFNRKMFFELKEIKEEITSLAVKIDKVPTVVDQILSKSNPAEQAAQNTSTLNESIQDVKTLLVQKISELENLMSNPIPEETDPKILEVHKMLETSQSSLSEYSKNFDTLEGSLKEIKKGLSSLGQLAPAFPDPLPETQLSEEIPLTPELADPIEEETEPEALPSEEESTESIVEIVAEEVELEEEDPTNDSETPITEELEALAEAEDLTEPEPLVEEPVDEQEANPNEQEVELSEEDLTAEQTEEEEPPGNIIETPSEDSNDSDNELKLDLPDPAETIRKVDALLAGEKLPQKTEPEEEKEKQPAKGGLTTITANVMIGIGNKPFVRGEGPGLSWDEGVAMNFVEIGKWAWSPPRKNVSLTIQIYRNDEDPDKGGKYEIKPGEKFELTPDF